jgi:large subunit ribosomal protein L29
VSKLSDRRKEVADLNVLEAQKQVQELRLKLFNLRLQQQRGEVKNSRVFAQTRKDIARLQHRITILENEQDDTAI